MVRNYFTLWRKTRSTLRGQLIMRYLIIIGLLLLFSAAFQYFALRQFLLQATVQRLSVSARYAVQSYHRDGDPTLAARLASDRNTAAWVTNPAGNLEASAIPPGPNSPWREPSPTGPPTEIVGNTLVVRIPLRGPPHPPALPRLKGPLLMLATSLAPVYGVLAAETRLLVLGGILVLMTAGVGGGLVLARGLKPLQRVAATADQVAAGHLDQRATLDDIPEEVARVARAFNAMLDRLAKALMEERQGRDQLRRFLADASHELRTPVTAISGFLEVLRAGAADDPIVLQESLKTTHLQARRMARLVDRLLALARLEHPGVDRRQPMDIRQWLRNIWPELEAAVGDHGLHFIADDDFSSDSALQVVADADILERALINLVENAGKFSPIGSPVEVRLQRAQGELGIGVRDHGAGIAAEDLPHVFERFYRGQRPEGREVPGTGLGLAIVQAAARANGGHVELTSPQDGGTLARLWIPLPGKTEGNAHGPAQSTHRNEKGS